jgi:uncharacterized membrane protein YccC
MLPIFLLLVVFPFTIMELFSLSWYLARYLGRFLDHSVGIVIVCLLLFLHFQVVLNRKKEFQWQRLALFLRVGATRYAQLILLSQIQNRETEFLI